MGCQDVVEVYIYGAAASRLDVNSALAVYLNSAPRANLQGDNGDRDSDLQARGDYVTAGVFRSPPILRRS